MVGRGQLAYLIECWRSSDDLAGSGDLGVPVSKSVGERVVARVVPVEIGVVVAFVDAGIGLGGEHAAEPPSFDIGKVPGHAQQVHAARRNLQTGTLIVEVFDLAQEHRAEVVEESDEKLPFVADGLGVDQFVLASAIEAVSIETVDGANDSSRPSITATGWGLGAIVTGRINPSIEVRTRGQTPCSQRRDQLHHCNLRDGATTHSVERSAVGWRLCRRRNRRHSRVAPGARDEDGTIALRNRRREMRAVRR